MRFRPSFLQLEDGSRFDGFSPSWQEEAVFGETVFTTGMTGYEESLTDPSFAGQILTFTYPMIGNYGVPDEERWESTKIHAAGVIVSEACTNWSHASSLHSLVEWLLAQRIPLITGVDTRAITHLLRRSGSLLGLLSNHEVESFSFLDPNKLDLVGRVTTPKPFEVGEGEKRVIVVDCGMKSNIMRCLRKLPLRLAQVPYNYDYTEEEFDGIFISNGPGDPIQCRETVRHLKKAMEKKKPIFGICLGTQLMALAAGAQTYKLPFGHRGHNQPCINVETEECFITSQNHGYAIDEKTLPADWEVSYRNLNDGSVEGIKHRTLPFSAVQFHPEAAPGPTDTEWLFNAFMEQLS